MNCVVASLLAGLLASADRPAAAYARPELLMEAADLRNPATARKFFLFDARGRPKYAAGHIPGAVAISPTEWARAFGDGQDRAGWERRLGALGIDTDTPVIVYDDHATPDAGRVWWILRYWGVRDVRLLNGGWRAWQEAGGPVSREEPAVTPRRPRLTPQPDRLATKDQLKDWLPGKRYQVLDTRSRAEYCGETELAKRGGAIPGAVHLEWKEVIDAKRQRFKGPEELARLFREKGIALDRPAVTHCQSGARSSVMAYALELMGAKDVRNYYKGWAEWGNADDTPVIKPPKP